MSQYRHAGIETIVHLAADIINLLTHICICVALNHLHVCALNAGHPKLICEHQSPYHQGLHTHYSNILAGAVPLL